MSNPSPTQLAGTIVREQGMQRNGRDTRRDEMAAIRPPRHTWYPRAGHGQ